MPTVQGLYDLKKISIKECFSKDHKIWSHMQTQKFWNQEQDRRSSQKAHKKGKICYPIIWDMPKFLLQNLIFSAEHRAVSFIWIAVVHYILWNIFEIYTRYLMGKQGGMNPIFQHILYLVICSHTFLTHFILLMIKKVFDLWLSPSNIISSTKYHQIHNKSSKTI